MIRESDMVVDVAAWVVWGSPEQEIHLNDAVVRSVIPDLDEEDEVGQMLTYKEEEEEKEDDEDT